MGENEPKADGCLAPVSKPPFISPKREVGGFFDNPSGSIAL